MTHELDAEECQKLEKCSTDINTLSNKLKKTIRNVKRCRETCQSTSAMIVELNGLFKNT